MLFGLFILFVIVATFAIGWYVPGNSQPVYQDPCIFLEIYKINRNLNSGSLTPKVGLPNELNVVKYSHNCHNSIIARDE